MCYTVLRTQLLDVTYACFTEAQTTSTGTVFLEICKADMCSSVSTFAENMF